MGESKYVGAPYNFVSLSERVVERYTDISELPAHNHLDKNRYSGRIVYEIKAESPIMIDSGENTEKKDKDSEKNPGQFYKNANGNFAIPGSSIRGLVRNNVQVLGFSSVGDDVENYRLMYRVVGQAKDNPLKGKYRYIMKKRKAGYLMKEGKDYYIYDTVSIRLPDNRGGMNYYPLSERVILSQKMDFFKKENNRLQNLEIKGKNGVKENSEYIPYFTPVSYRVKNARVTHVGEPKADYDKQGYIISSGYIPDKKMQYIIPQIDQEKERILVDKEFIRDYLNDYKSKEKQLGKMRDFFALPKEGEQKPVFYIKEGNQLYFGFTPNLRLFYNYKIHDGLPEEHKVNPDRERNEVLKLDYNRSLFGFAVNQMGYKSRLQFFDAVAERAEKEEQKEMILSSPKPTSYRDYLVGEDGGVATYNTSSKKYVLKAGFRLRGIKQYWLHTSLAKINNGENENILTKFVPLKKGTTFRGEVHFHNLTEDELGLLLWSITLNTDSRQNIGKGKPYGFGNISVSIQEIKLLDFDKMYGSERLCLTPEKEEKVSVCDLIEKYKKYMKGKLGNEIEKMPNIVEFFHMKSKDCIPKDQMTRYMKIDSNKDKDEYRNRATVLPKVMEVVQAVKS